MLQPRNTQTAEQHTVIRGHQSSLLASRWSVTRVDDTLGTQPLPTHVEASGTFQDCHQNLAGGLKSNAQLDMTCLDATGNSKGGEWQQPLGSRTCSMRTGCTRTAHPAWLGSPCSGSSRLAQQQNQDCIKTQGHIHKDESACTGANIVVLGVFTPPSPCPRRDCPRRVCLNP